MEDKGHCEHGPFILSVGCPQCIANRMGQEGNTAASIAEEIAKTNQHNLVKVQYYSETTGELNAREYTYYSEERLSVDDLVIVPVRNTRIKGKVSAIDVPDSEIASFRDKVKTIPAGSIIKVRPEKIEEGLNTKGFTLRQLLPLEDMPINATGDTSETAIALRPGEDDEVRVYSKQAVGLLVFAERRVIATLEDNKDANNDLATISKLKKQMGAKKRKYLDPLKTQSDAIRETFNYLMTPVLEAEKLTKDKMLAYDAEQKRIRKEQEEVNQLRMEAAKKEASLNNGELTESVNLVEVIPEQTGRVSTEMGTSGIKGNWKWEVTDFALVPDEYKIINPAVLTPAAKSYKDTRTIPGIRIYNEPIIAQRAR